MESFINTHQMPQQQLSYKSKGKNWRIQCVEALDNQMHIDYNKIRASAFNKRINEGLLNGHLCMDDVQLLVNPDNIKAGYIPEKIQHYDTINPKLQVLLGEELKRVWDWKVKITNANALSELEEQKKQEIYQAIKEEVENISQSEEEFQANIEKKQQYFTYEWQDFREVWANCLLNHYVKEYNIPLMFNYGFRDALCYAEEIYQCDIEGGEPIVRKLNPRHLEIYMGGYSNKIEDADRIIITDYWQPGRIFDTFYDVLTTSDIKKIEDIQHSFSRGSTDSMDNWDERQGFVSTRMITDVMTNVPDSTLFFDPFGDYSDAYSNDLLPFDRNGNIRVVKVYWKSRRKIKKIKFYDPESGEEDFTFMPETYIANQSMGEEEQSFWINEAWEGTKIAKDIYVNVRPRPVQYNRLSNPSRCHFGIIGTIYNYGDQKPFSMVDRMKPFAYLYDIVHDRLNKLIARNWGIMTRLDLAKMPKQWTVDKWLYYAKTMGLYIEDSFNEGMYGAATGKIAGALNNAGQNVINADFGNNIQQYVNLLEYIKSELADVAGISKQREGQISNRETVGGVERATLQSSHITEWLFAMHDDNKKRVLEAFLETAKIAYRGRNKKFQYILPDYSSAMIDIDGDAFAECDYGLVIDNSNGLQELNQKLETLAQAALQNQSLSFGTIMKLFMSASIAEKQRFVEADERRIKEEQQKQMQQQQQMQEQQLQMQQQIAQQEQQFKDAINQRDNETKIMVAEINSQAEMAILQLKNHMTVEDELEEQGALDASAKEKLMQDMQMLDKKLQLERDKMAQNDKQFNANLDFQKRKAEVDAELKRKQINKSSKTSSK